MTRPLPSDDQTSYDTLRRRWLTRYARIQAKTDTKIRTALLASAEDAHKRLTFLGTKSSFSAGVRTAQIRLALKELKSVHLDLFNELFPIIKDGQSDEAAAAVDGLTDTDRRYLLASLGSSPSVKYFVESQRQAARNGVAHAITSITKSREPLSHRVYRTRSLANNWVERLITSSILRGDSAQDIAKAVRSHIRPGTPGGTAYAAMRLGRTELNNAFHATSVEISKDRPWIEGMLWNLSKVHEFQSPPEICERLAGRIFTVENVPKKPHPQCRCFVTPNLIPFEMFLTLLESGQYREWTSQNEAA